MFKITLHILIMCLFIGCSTTFQWKQPLQRSPELPLVFNKYKSLGIGLKTSDLGYHAMPCLESFKTTLSGGTLDIEFRKVTNTNHGNNREIDHFIESGLNRAKKYNLGEIDPISFVLVIKVKNRLAAIQEETIKFRADVEKLIYAADNQELFFRTCGTEYIHTVKFDSEIFFFFSFYPKSAESAALLEKKIKKRTTKVKNNIFQVSIFKDLKLDTDTFFSLKVDTDILFEPIEFAFKEIHGKELDLFLNKMIHSVLNSDSGTFKHYISSPWTRLDALRSRTTGTSKMRITEYSDEQIFKSLQLLENSIKRYQLRFQEVKKLAEEAEHEEQNTDPDRCATIFKKATKYINWNTFNKCRKTAVSTRTINLESLAECSPISEAITGLNFSRNCFEQVQKGKTQQTHLKDTIYLPLELVDHLVDDPLSIHRKETGYRFNDEDQTKLISPKVILGQGVDRTGRFYEQNCIIEKSKQISGNKAKRDIAITNDYFPYEIREWPWYKKLFQFWKDFPEWTQYRGSFEIEGFSPLLLPNFEITKEAKQLATRNITGFFKRFGTHYVERIRHRRGFVYYFSPDAREEDDIEIIPFGMASPKSAISILAELANNTRSLLDPKTVKEFFTNKDKLIKLFKDDDAAVPIRLSLKPWSEYLVNRGILTPEQLSPTELLN